MSFLRYMTFKSFRYYHPNWNIKLIRRKTHRLIEKYRFREKQDWMTTVKDYSHRLDDLSIEVQYLEDVCPEIASMDISDVHISDLLAWNILAKRGGVISDTDIIYTKSFDYDKFCDVDFGIVSFERRPKANYMPVSFMVGKPNEICEKIYDKARAVVNKHIYESAGTPALTKAVGNFHKMIESFPSLNIQRLPSKIVFPWAEEHPWRFYSDFAFKENLFKSLHETTIGIHWYAGANQQYNKIYTEDTYMDFDTTISSAIKACHD